MYRTADLTIYDLKYLDWKPTRIASRFIDQRDEGVGVAVVNKTIFYGSGI